MRTLSLVIALSLLVLPGTSIAGEDDEIQELLDRRAKAVTNRDLSAFMDSVDAQGKEFHDEQIRVAQRLMKVPVDRYSLKVSTNDFPELTRKRDKERHGKTARVLHVVERLGIAGVDDEPSMGDLFFTFVWRTDEWKIVGDRDVEDLGLLTTRHPWEFGDVQIKKSSNFTLIYHPESAELADQLLRFAQDALALQAEVWPMTWRQHSPIIVPATEEELKKLLGVTFDVSSFVAFASASVDQEAEDGWDLSGSRITLNPKRFLRHSESSRRTILAHELVHASTHESTGPFVPHFIDEGIAELTQKSGVDSLPAAVRAGGYDRRLPEDWEFSAGTSGQIRDVYLESESAVAFMKQTWGIPRILELYAALGSRQLEPGTSEYQFDVAIRQVLGIGAAEFESRWADFIAARPR